MDLAILIALKEEFNLFFQTIQERCTPLPDTITGRYYYRFEHIGAVSGKRYQCITTFVGDMGPTRTSVITQQLINRWQPQTLILLGIAAGLSKDVQLGDVVIASQVDAYLENAKAVPGKSDDLYELHLSGDGYRTSNDLLNIIRNFNFAYATHYTNWQKQCAYDLQQNVVGEMSKQSEAAKLIPDLAQIVDGPIASGPVVGASQAFANWLKKRNRKYVALEMESAGLMTALYEETGSQRVLILRAISDYGDERKGQLDDISGGIIRSHAMKNATRLLWSILDAELLPAFDQTAPTDLADNHASSANSSDVNISAGKDNKSSASIPYGNVSANTSSFHNLAFISYCDRDKKYLEELHTHLEYYRRSQTFITWDGTLVSPGSNHAEETKKALRAAKVIVLLVSTDYLASDRITQNELLDELKREDITMLWVLLKPCPFRDTFLKDIQPVNDPTYPLSVLSPSKRDAVWQKLVTLIRDKLN